MSKISLYHFTSQHHLPGIARHGLTVGDVPTDIQRNLGRVGIWLTSTACPVGHGLEGSTVNKKQMRLLVELDDADPALAHWPKWAIEHATPATIQALHRSAAGFETWWIYFGHIASTSVRECIDLSIGQPTGWPDIPAVAGQPGVPYWRRHAWHKALIKKVKRHVNARTIGQ
jgi:hypothetical protein